MGEPRVTLDRFREALKAQPFQPFTLHLADGRQLHVPHRDFALAPPTGRTVVIVQRDGAFEIIDLLLAVGIEVRPAAGSAAQAP